MRTLVDLPQAHLNTLNTMSKARKVSRAELVRQAVASFISENKPKKPGFEASFGMWKDLDIDGVEYQQEIRSEWTDKWAE